MSKRIEKKLILKEYSSFLKRIRSVPGASNAMTDFLSLEEFINTKINHFLDKKKLKLDDQKFLQFAQILKKYLLFRLTRVLSPQRRNEILQKYSQLNANLPPLFQTKISYPGANSNQEGYSLSFELSPGIIFELLKDYNIKLYEKLSLRGSNLPNDIQILKNLTDLISYGKGVLSGKIDNNYLNRFIQQSFIAIADAYENKSQAEIISDIERKLNTQLNPNLTLFYKFLKYLAIKDFRRFQVHLKHALKAKREGSKESAINVSRYLRLSLKVFSFVSYETAEKLYQLNQEMKKIKSQINAILNEVYKKLS